MSSSRYNWLRSMGAYACLVAVMLIYAPQGMLAWWAGTGACCKSDYCPIPEHHHSRVPVAEHHGMECEHGAPGLAACTMSCCHDTERALLAPLHFVLQPVMQLPGQARIAQIVEQPAPQDIFQGSKPLSPPPRLMAAAA